MSDLLACASGRIADRYDQAARELFDCIKPTDVDGDILHQGVPIMAAG
tara:strand:- start:16720 stop:16863 length:144 start_codon:yes stop_codon:yes gene_type:complete